MIERKEAEKESKAVDREAKLKLVNERGIRKIGHKEMKMNQTWKEIKTVDREKWVG